MPLLRTLALILIMSISLIGCNTSQTSSGSSNGTDTALSGVLTSAKAQRTLDTWAAGRGQVSVVAGVQEITAQNAAVADLNFNSFQAEYQGQPWMYSGKGKATFVHTTDGKWILKEVYVGDFWSKATSYTPNLEVR